ncbi:MAG: GtrA family protein [Candidatus Colwellbacteria bacterium]|nr:GtrA family protein [Candidatus Colwellbacteria bacterium]
MKEKVYSQAAKFGIVGILNTLIDMLVLNLLIWAGFTTVFTVLGQKFLVANIISVSIAIVNSFILNRFWAFGTAKEKSDLLYEISKFLVVTVIGMFIIHQLIFNGIYYQFTGLTDFVYSIVSALHLDTIFSEGFVKTNFAKIIAIFGSLVWNFIGYKFFVFKK